MEEPFRADSLQRMIDRLPARGRLAFLLSCAERLLPNYFAFSRAESWGDPSALREAMDLGWAAFAGEQIATTVIEISLRRCEAVTPDTEQFPSALVSAALDAAVCSALVLDYLLGGESQKVVEGASLARDTVDMHVQELENLSPDDPLLEGKILRHSLMQRELARQSKDLDLLQRTDWTHPDVVTALRSRWRAPGISNIGTAAGAPTV